MTEAQLYGPPANGTGGSAIGPEAVAELVQRSLNDIATDLACPRIVALSYSQHDGLLRGARTVGFELADLQEIRFSLSAFPSAEQALRTRQIRPLSAAAALPPALQAHLRGELVVMPLALGERQLGVLVCQLASDASPRSPEWQARAEPLIARAAVIVELARLSAAYQDERRLRRATRAITAAILEGRSLTEIAAIITEQTSDRLGEARVGLYVVDAQGHYQPASLRNVSAEYADGIARLRRHSPFSARALATHLPYYTPDTQNDPQVTPALRALFERENIRSLLISVLHHGDRINGALVVYPQGDRRFTPREMTLFHALADQATLAISVAQQLEQQRDTATLEERNRLAREIHDTVAQSLAGVLMQVEMAESYLNAGDYDSVSAMLASARTRSRKALEDTRRAVQGLSPPALEQTSLAEALTEEARLFGTETGIETPFIGTGEAQNLTVEQRVALLRIAQEALNNVRKHSHAQRVRIGLHYGPDRVNLVVDDDGAGFDPGARAAPDSSGGYGLFGMEERARLLGGDVQVDSTRGWGTRIKASLPYRITRDSADNRAPEPLQRRPPDVLTERQESPTGANTLRILIADDHAIMRHGLRDILLSHGSIQLVGEASNGAEAVERALEVRPDVVLMDLQMPGVDGLEGLRRMQAEIPELPVIVLTAFETEGSVAQALSAGARGYLLKDTDPETLVAAIHAVHRGESQFSSPITDRLASLASGRAGRSSNDAPINEREKEVLNLLVHGSRNKEIAAELFITVSTVEKHIASLFNKLGVSNRAEAVRVAVERGLVATSAIPASPSRSAR